MGSRLCLIGTGSSRRVARGAGVTYSITRVKVAGSFTGAGAAVVAHVAASAYVEKLAGSGVLT